MGFEFNGKRGIEAIGDFYDVFGKEGLRNLPKSDIDQMLDSLVSAANKRIRRLEDQPFAENIPALKSKVFEGRKERAFSASGKTTEQKIQEIAEAEYWLGLETSTTPGAKRWQRTHDTGTLTKTQISKAWESYRRWTEHNPDQKPVSKEVVENIFKELKEDPKASQFGKKIISHGRGKNRVATFSDEFESKMDKMLDRKLKAQERREKAKAKQAGSDLYDGGLYTGI